MVRREKLGVVRRERLVGFIDKRLLVATGGMQGVVLMERVRLVLRNSLGRTGGRDGAWTK